MLLEIVEPTSVLDTLVLPMLLAQGTQNLAVKTTEQARTTTRTVGDKASDLISHIYSLADTAELAAASERSATLMSSGSEAKVRNVPMLS